MSLENALSVTASLPDTVTVKISLVSFPNDFLGLYFLDTDRFSDQVTGVLGAYCMDVCSKECTCNSAPEVRVQTGVCFRDFLRSFAFKLFFLDI